MHLYIFVTNIEVLKIFCTGCQNRGRKQNCFLKYNNNVYFKLHYSILNSNINLNLKIINTLYERSSWCRAQSCDCNRTVLGSIPSRGYEIFNIFVFLALVTNCYENTIPQKFGRKFPLPIIVSYTSVLHFPPYSQGLVY